MVVKSKGTSPKSPKNSGLGIILICPELMENHNSRKIVLRITTQGKSQLKLSF